MLAGRSGKQIGQSGNYYNKTDSAGNLQRYQKIPAAPRENKNEKSSRQSGKKSCADPRKADSEAADPTESGSKQYGYR